jgi:hypothetical protein
MADLSVRSDSVNVEQIMKQIRGRIREKRGADYTQAELQQLASAKLEQFADPSGLRSDLLEQFRKRGDEPSTYHRHRGMRRVLLMIAHPILKRVQKQLMADLNLYFEIIHNLVVEVTRLGIEVQNLKMKVESLSSRLDFDERRARSLEGVVQYRQRPSQPASSGSSSGPRPSGPHPGSSGPSGSAGPAPSGPHSGSAGPSGASGPAASGPSGATGPVGSTSAAAPTGPTGNAGGPVPADPGSGGMPGQPRVDGERRRRRLRRRRRPGHNLADSPNAGPQSGAAPQASSTAGSLADDDGPDTDGGDEDDGAPDQ